MKNAFSKLSDTFKYKAPKGGKDFELLESEKEDKNHAKSSKISEKSRENKGKDIGDSEKNGILKNSSLTIALWNNMRKNNTSKNEKVEINRVSADLNLNMNAIKSEFKMNKNQGIEIRSFNIAGSVKAFLLFISSVVDEKIVNQSILKQLMNCENFNICKNKPITDFILDNVLPIDVVSKETNMNKIILEVLNGKTALFIDGYDECIVIKSVGYQKRNVDKPITENVVKGAQEAFTENLETNIALIRRILRNKSLIVETQVVGRADNSRCAIIYLDDVSNPRIVDEIKRRIGRFEFDMIMGGGIIEQMIEDNPYAIFPQVLSTERPDRTAALIMEGKVAVIANGTPFAEIVPITFFHLFHTSEDSLLRWEYGTFLRIIRLLAVFISIYLPGMYVSLTLFHQEMIPTELLLSIAQARVKVPFPTIVEIIGMELSFELIREAGIRVPGVIGQTLGILGALILGQAAVAAGLVSPVLIIVVALTGLGNFALPNYTLALAIRIIRFGFIIFAAIAGFYGIAISTFLLGCLMCSIKSFGVPYFAPMAPKTKSNRDLIIRPPIWTLSERPDFLNTVNRKRKSKNKKNRKLNEREEK